ncbi:MAG: hypothetical protein Q9160_006477 [Pyrenula sp. 1 TL-2023]
MDQKRQHAGGKTANTTAPALPQTGTPNLVSLNEALCAAIGARIRVTVTSPVSTTYEGTLMTADPITQLLVIATSPPPTDPSVTSLSGSFHIIPIASLASVPTILSIALSSQTSSFTAALPALAPLPIAALRAREEAAIRAIKERDQKRGKGVTKEAQEIFDALGKTLPVAWKGTGILVSDSVLVEPPYRIGNCRATGGGDSALSRVRKVLEMELKKLELRRASANIKLNDTLPAMPKNGVGMRKGG